MVLENETITMATTATTAVLVAEQGKTTTVNNNESPSTTLTIRMVMQGKEVGSIIGKKGDNIKKYREESGAKINISDGSCPERIVTITGTTDQIFKAFDMICKKFEEDLQNTVGPNNSVPLPPITLRLVVPASQCGCLIGKGGCKIKEIREVTGASIQVASEMLPNSTERAVTISGKAEAITQCVYHICCIMIDSPPKGATIPYRPKPVVPPVIFAGGQAFTTLPAAPQYLMPQPATAATSPDIMKMPHIQYGNQMIPMLTQQQLSASTIMPSTYGSVAPAGRSPGGMTPAGNPSNMVPASNYGNMVPASNYGSMALSGNGTYGSMAPASISPISSYATVRTTVPQTNNNQQTHEMNIPNDLIGCIIGRGGQKINEIRQLSGAIIKISNVEEGSADRKVTITGTPETINMAQYLINTSMELHKQMQMTLDPTSNPTTTLTSSPSPMIPTMMKPLSVSGMPLLGLNAGLLESSVWHKSLVTKVKGGVDLPNGLKAERSKFAPY
ncbi:poly(rC)-binding protein 3 isoform X2 [Lingula anatina]|uniref:Poly(RC)-binding protein 3 isoform X2 n=1 Tax=Lingula anatina TaxID=7574 RepID=A0A1S3I7A6_LINAN|nr:poly(rC)-binding protein 3 isoform X2 [Lingula anatina]|eukprot:XP_013394083.1 poly(rC)-binding protein 3 isoform X2 [Lingula anatina]